MVRTLCRIVLSSYSVRLAIYKNAFGTTKCSQAPFTSYLFYLCDYTALFCNKDKPVWKLFRAGTNGSVPIIFRKMVSIDSFLSLHEKEVGHTVAILGYPWNAGNVV